MSKAHETKVYVGNLGRNGDKDELWNDFSKFGKVRDVWVARNPPGFAFVEFEEALDASDAVRELDGRSLCGRTARVEISSTRSRGGSGGGGGRGGGGGGRRFGGRDNYRGDRGGRYNDDYRREDDYDRDCRRSPPPRRR